LIALQAARKLKDGTELANLETRLANQAKNLERSTGTKRGGDPGWIRTSDLQLRRLLLYPLSYGAVPGGL
jgi:hypothetical protein